MTFEKNKNNDQLTISVKGRLDTTTSPELESGVREDLANCKTLVYDFKDLEYISSAGLRVLLKNFKTVGNLRIINASDVIKDVLQLTGLSDVFNVA